MWASVLKKSPSVSVRPSAEPIIMTGSDTTIKLCALDKASFPLSVLLVYQHPIHDAADTIKTALSHALVHYYPFCGRIVVVSGGAGDDAGGSYIECSTGAGQGAVAFVAASADCSLQASKLLERLPSYGSDDHGGGGGMDTSSASSPPLIDELAVCYGGGRGGYGPGDPLLAVQVTEFACGGFVVGATWNHAVADGVGIAQLLGAVGELAGYGSLPPPPPSVVSVRWDEAEASQPPPPTNPAWLGGGPPEQQQQLRLVFLDVTIPASFIGRVKAEFAGGGSSSSASATCTTLEVVLAALWQCRTRAIMSPEDKDKKADTLSVLTFPVNVRKLVGAKDGYYGNCVVDKVVMAASSSVAATTSPGIVHLVDMIKNAKDQLAADLQQQQLNRKKDEEDKNVPQDDHQLRRREENKYYHQLLRQQGLDLDRYSMLTVSSWRNIGFEEADFGSGKPARVICPGAPPFPCCIVAFKGGDDGVNVLSFCVKEEHADAFLAEIAKLT